MNNKAVLITGASTGIGYDASLALARKGFKVFACVRNSKDKEKLQAGSPNIEGVLLDVTKSQQIQEAFDFISKQTFETFHLVNNAGIVVVGPVETLSVSEFKRQFDVNFFGLIATTQKFLPFVRRTKGRIINISSVSGLASSPFLSAYSASKFAVESLSDSLRWELGSSGVKVTIIEPGPIATPIWQKSLGMEEEIKSSIPEEHKSYYHSAISRFAKIVRAESARALSVDKVTEAIVDALTAKNPPARIVVSNASRRIQLFSLRFLNQKWVDRVVHKTLFR